MLRDVLTLAAKRTGRDVTVADLFADARLLGPILAGAERASGDTEVSGWTVAARRTATRAAASLLDAELREAGIPDALGLVHAALRLWAERVGSTYRLPKPPVRNRGGRTPDAREAAAVVEAAGARPGWLGERDAIFIELLVTTGCRVNAARALTGDNIVREADGSGRMLVHAKHHADSGEFVIPATLLSRIDAYAATFNAWAAARGRSERVGTGVPSALWRSVRGGAMSYADLGKRLAAACERARVERLTPHAFRRAFATIATASLPRLTVSSAGGWSNTRLMDAHYIQRTSEAMKQQVFEATRRGGPVEPGQLPRRQRPLVSVPR